MASEHPTRGTRLPNKLDGEFEEYRDQNDMTNSGALRTLVRKGLKAEKSDPLDDRPDAIVAGLIWDAQHDIHSFVLITLVALLLSSLTSGLISSAFAVLSAAYALTIVVGVVDTLFLGDRLQLRLIKEADRITIEVAE